jgi:hypothetical protein
MGHTHFRSMVITVIYYVKTYISQREVQALSDTSMEVDLKVNAKKMKYMFMPHYYKEESVNRSQMDIKHKT